MSSQPNSYQPGGNVRLIGTFQNSGGTLVDPATVTLTLVPPVQLHGRIPGTVTYTYASGSVQQAVAGSYYYDLNPIPAGTPGVWTAIWTGSAPNVVFIGQVNVYQR